MERKAIFTFSFQTFTPQKLLKFLLSLLLLYAAVCVINMLIVACTIAFYPAVVLNDMWLVYGISVLVGILFSILRYRKYLGFNSQIFHDKKIPVIIWTLIVLPSGFLMASLFSETNFANELNSFSAQILHPFESLAVQLPVLSTVENPLFYLAWIFTNSFIGYDMLVMFGAYWLIKTAFVNK